MPEQPRYYVDGHAIIWRKFVDLDELFAEAANEGDAHRIVDTLNHLAAQAESLSVLRELLNAVSAERIAASPVQAILEAARQVGNDE